MHLDTATLALFPRKSREEASARLAARSRF